MPPLIDVKDLKVWFHTRNGIVKAVDGINFSVDKGETLAIVGESGSGKSVTCYSFLDLIPTPPGRIESGQALFEGNDLFKADKKSLRQIRGNDIAVIFQDPMTCLNPYLSIGEQLIEPLIYHHNAGRPQAKARAIAMLDEVGIVNAEQRFNHFPHEFSGGMRQRVMIAMALITEPKLLICDEPTTALDVTIQRQILKLIKSLQEKLNISVIFISHDLGVVAGIADRVIVMKDGKIVESNDAPALFSQPTEMYTQQLLASIPNGVKPITADDTENQTISKPLVEINHLTVTFKDHSSSGKNSLIKAVYNVSLSFAKNNIIGLVGESGSGKSTLGRAILGLAPIAAGQVNFDGERISELSPRQLTPWRKKMQMIFQDPYASLNPRMTVFQTLAEPLLYHRLANKKNVTEQVMALMDDVGLSHNFVRKYPHEFSGGQRQRIAIGRAIATKPQFIVADEPVSALDVTIQAQILDLLLQLVERHNLTMLFISHDLSVVRYLADQIVVMKHGEIIEQGRTEAIWHTPQQPYTRELMAAVPLPDPARERERLLG